MNNLVKLLSLLLALCVVLCACGTTGGRESDGKDDENPLKGEWTVSVDCGPLCNDMIKQALGTELAGYLDFSGTGFDLILTFDGTDSYTLKPDQASLGAFSDDAVDIILTGMRAYLAKSLEFQMIDQTLDEYLASVGTSFEALMAESGLDAEVLADAMVSTFDAMNITGKYSVEDGKLKLDSDVHPYELDGNRLTIQLPEGNTDTFIEFLFPMELTKTN